MAKMGRKMKKSGGMPKGNTGKPMGMSGMKAKGNKRTKQVADRYK